MQISTLTPLRNCLPASPARTTSPIESAALAPSESYSPQFDLSALTSRPSFSAEPSSSSQVAERIRSLLVDCMLEATRASSSSEVKAQSKTFDLATGWLISDPLIKQAEVMESVGYGFPWKPLIISKGPAADPLAVAKVLLQRGGRIVKEDQYPDIGSSSVPGAPNYRKEGDFQGTGQPTEAGLKNLCELNGGADKVMWINMRAEPVIYIKGIPYNLRPVGSDNASNVGIDAAGVESQEAALKAMLLREAKANGGRILLYREVSKDHSVAEWVDIEPSQIETSRELADRLGIEYRRVPVSDESAPSPEAVDQLAAIEEEAAKEGKNIVVNCHAGKGRTTTAITIMDMHRKAREAGSTTLSEVATSVETDPFAVLVRLAKESMEAIIKADEAIDRHQTIQNVRTRIAEAKDDEREAFIDRYALLVLAAVHCDPSAPGHHLSFSKWSQKYAGLHSLVNGMVRTLVAPLTKKDLGLAS